MWLTPRGPMVLVNAWYDVVRALKSILSHQRKQVAECVDVLPAVQRALNTSFRERYRNTPYCVMFGRALHTSFSSLTTVTGGEWNVDGMDADSLRAKVHQVVDEQERFCKDAQAAVAVSRETNVK